MEKQEWKGGKVMGSYRARMCANSFNCTLNMYYRKKKCDIERILVATLKKIMMLKTGKA